MLRGVIGFAAGSLSRSLLRSELRASLNWVQVVVVLGLLATYLYVLFPEDSLLSGGKVELRDHLDVLREFLNTPFVQLVPVFVVLLACGRFASEIGHRYVSSTRVRVRVESYVLAKLIIGAGTAFVVFAVWAMLAFIVAFFLWPAIGDPSINPHDYGFTAASAVTDSYTRTTYSQLLQVGPWAYGIFYSVWLGLCAATYAAIGMAALMVIRRRPVALAVPFMLFFVQSAAFALLGLPGLALNASMFPFGLSQEAILVGVAPTAVVMASTVVVWLLLLRRLAKLENIA